MDGRWKDGGSAAEIDHTRWPPAPPLALDLPPGDPLQPSLTTHDILANRVLAPMKRRILLALALPATLLTGCDSVPFFKRAPTSAVAEATPSEPLSGTAEAAHEAQLSLAADTEASRAVSGGASVHPAAPADAQESSLQLASAELPSTARRTIDAIRASLPNPVASRHEKLARAIADFEPFPFAFDLPTVSTGPIDPHGPGDEANPTTSATWLSSEDATDQLLVVDIWATWCAPCQKAIPDFVAIQQQYESQGVQVVGITCDSPDAAQTEAISRRAIEIGQRLGVNYPMLLDDGSTTSQVPGFRGYPTTLFVTPDGMVRYKVTGAQPKEALAAVVDILLER